MKIKMVVIIWLVMLMILIFHVFKKPHPRYEQFTSNYNVFYNRTEPKDIGTTPNYLYSVNSLDRHDVKCLHPEGILNGFSLKLDRNNRGYYDYTCYNMQDIDVQQLPATWTMVSDVDKFESAYMERHKVGESCGENSGLSRFRLLSHYTPNKINYEYNCSKMRPKDSSMALSNVCQQRETFPVPEQWGVERLIDTRVQCKANEVLKDFKLVRDNNTQKVVYTCCDVNLVKKKENAGILEVPDQ